MTWTLACSACGTTAATLAGATTCQSCHQPLFAQYATVPRSEALLPRWDMWRYRAWLPVHEGESPVTLGEGLTPLV